MELSVTCYLILLCGVAGSRLGELRLSERHRQALARQKVASRADPQYRWMVFLHAGVLAGAAAEVIWLRRPFIPAVAATAGVFFLLAAGLRWWAIASLGRHWNVQVMDSASLGIVTSGPFRWVRHPNYLGVFVEMAALPMIYTAWMTAVLAIAGNIWVLKNRLRVEEAMLESHPQYREAMAAKARFVPGIF